MGEGEKNIAFISIHRDSTGLILFPLEVNYKVFINIHESRLGLFLIYRGAT